MGACDPEQSRTRSQVRSGNTALLLESGVIWGVGANVGALGPELALLGPRPRQCAVCCAACRAAGGSPSQRCELTHIIHTVMS